MQTAVVYQFKGTEKHEKKLKDKRNQGTQARVRARAFVNSVKTYLGCIDCGYDKDPRALAFDHVRGVKTSSISRMMSKGYSISSIKKEMGKCECRCANCHSIVTHQRLNLEE